MAKDSFIFHLENAEELDDLTLEEQGLILQAMIQYSRTGEEPEFEDRALRTAWRPIYRRLKADAEAYEEKCEANRLNGQKGGRPPKNQTVFDENPKNRTVIDGFSEKPKKADSDSDTDSESDIEKESKRKSAQRFSPPSVEEVREYVREKQYNVDPEAFVAFYASKGWKVGNQTMKNWRAAVVTWSKRDNRAGPKKSYMLSDGMTHTYDMDELRRRAKE